MGPSREVQTCEVFLEAEEGAREPDGVTATVTCSGVQQRKTLLGDKVHGPCPLCCLLFCLPGIKLLTLPHQESWVECLLAFSGPLASKSGVAHTFACLCSALRWRFSGAWSQAQILQCLHSLSKSSYLCL